MGDSLGVVGRKLVSKKKTTRERRRQVAQAAEMKQVSSVMSREEIEAYIDRELERRFPPDAPVGGPVAVFIEAIGGYIKQTGYCPSFGVVPPEMKLGLDAQLYGQPSWGLSTDKQSIAGVRVIEAKTRSILLGR